MFQNAKPIWLSERSCEMNTLASFRTELCASGEATLCVSAASFYRAYLDGVFLAFGPARTAKGYARVDVLPLTLTGKHELVIEAVGYYAESLTAVKQPSFCIAEVTVDGKPIAWTGRDFEAYAPAYHVQKVDRYSIQRHFTEVRDYRRGISSVDPACRAEVEILTLPIAFLDRIVPYPAYDAFTTAGCTSYGTLAYDEAVKEKLKMPDRPKNAHWERWGNFEIEEMPTRPYLWAMSQRQIAAGGAKALPLTIGAGEYAIFDFAQMETGFLKTAFAALEESDVIVAFSEYYEQDGDFKIHNSTRNVLEYFAAKGQQIDTQSFEPYSFRFAMVTVKSGRIMLSHIGGIRFEHPTAGVSEYDCGSDLRNLIYRASVRTLVQNSTDIYMDCPSRERAGWLCDSYFSGRVEKKLFGCSDVERAFLQNFRLYQNEGEIPAGALPMCYPAGFINNNDFIPQWNMWYVLEVEEYLTEREPNEDRAQFYDSVMGVVNFLSRYENADGLLEKLPSWNFVEWSRANKWVQDVNYPTNFLYSRVLRAAYNLFGDESLLEKSRRVAAEAKRQSFNGELFTDHAIRQPDGTLQNAGHISEICQYYALLLADIDPCDPTYAKLIDMLPNVFLPSRVATSEFDVEPINAFIGVYLRMDTLLHLGAYKQALSECEEFFGGMAQKTLTLWENRTLSASCNHGFASYAAVVMMKCIDGMR